MLSVLLPGKLKALHRLAADASSLFHILYSLSSEAKQRLSTLTVSQAWSWLLLAQVEQVIPQAKSAGQDLQKAAESTVSDVQKAADSASKEAGQTINAAQDTVDLVSPQPRCAHTELSLQ